MALPSDSANPDITNPQSSPVGAMDNFMNFSKGMFSQMEKMIQGVGQAKQGDKNFQYNALLGHLNKLNNYGASRNEVYGADITAAIRRAMGDLRDAGGANASGGQVSTILNNLSSALHSIVPQIRAAGGNELGAQYLSKMSSLMGTAASGALQKGDIRGIKATEPEMTKTNFLQDGVNNINAAISDSATKIFDIGDTLNDATLKGNIQQISTDLLTASDAATTTADKLAALNDALAKVETATAATQSSTTATANDKAQTASLKTTLEANSVAVKKDVALRAKGLPFMQKHAQFLNTMRGMASKAYPVMTAVSVAKMVGEKIHDFIEQGAQKQIKISSERAKFGRYLYGTNIGYGDLIGAVGTGRRAGLQDSEVISMLGDVGKQLAAARWGEGGLAEKAGRWGISIWDEQGKMLNQNQLFAQMSKTMNAMTDKEEKLQFLYDMGYGPEKFEFFENYARDAERNEYKKRHPGTRSTLENAEIFDESGRNRKIDAYTQMVFKRREIEKQNAWDKGILRGWMNQTFNPEYWFAPNYTARQEGIKNADYEEALKALEKTLRDNIKAVNDNTASNKGKGGKGGKSHEVTAEDLETGVKAKQAKELGRGLVDKMHGSASNFAYSQLKDSYDKHYELKSDADKVAKGEMKFEEFSKKWKQRGFDLNENEVAEISNRSSMTSDIYVGYKVASMSKDISQRLGRAQTFDKNLIDTKEHLFNVESARYGMQEALVRQQVRAHNKEAEQKGSVLDYFDVEKKVEESRKGEWKPEYLEESSLINSSRKAYDKNLDLKKKKYRVHGVSEKEAEERAKEDLENESMLKQFGNANNIASTLSDYEGQLEELNKKGELSQDELRQKEILQYAIKKMQKFLERNPATEKEGEVEQEGGAEPQESVEHSPTPKEEETVSPSPHETPVAESSEEKVPDELLNYVRPEENDSGLSPVPPSWFRSADPAAMAEDAQTQAAYDQSLAALGPTWFKVAPNRKYFSDLTGTTMGNVNNATQTMATNMASAKSATEQMEETSTMASAAAASGIDAQQSTEATAKSGDSKKTGGMQNNQEITNTVNITVTGDANPDEIASAVEKPLRAFAEAVVSVTPVGDGN